MSQESGSQKGQKSHMGYMGTPNLTYLTDMTAMTNLTFHYLCAPEKSFGQTFHSHVAAPGIKTGSKGGKRKIGDKTFY
jgi:hypothetical protein